ncbi:Csu type fimbrial protein [Gilvimarinus polysaccharolyticus]|uniref:Csu type fimbrial protein n=1 Tax=Gilvimarinus polysaccharolyticus TaxID=863921 RepID=UPI0006734BFB|nr:spore coat U domain-containing protein [Gilvimarinus polysaccharolyticus]
MKPSKSILLGLIFSGLLSLANSTLATTNCNASASDLVFGNISMGATQNNTATVNIECNTFGLSLLATARVRMCLNIDAGVATNSTVNARTMSTASLEQVQFQIYRDAGRYQTWSNTVASDVDIDLQYSVPVLGGSGTTSAILYGQIPAQLALATGNHQNSFVGAHTRLDYRYAERLLGTPSWPTSCTSGGNGGGSITFPFNANATVPASCVIDVVNNLNFGSTPGLISSNQDQTTNFSFTCTKTTPWKVSLDDGLHAVGATRHMRLGTTENYVEYELYRDSGRTLRWGNTPDVDTVNNAGTGSSQNLTIYGRVPAPQSLPSGSYSDTVTVTITY